MANQAPSRTTRACNTCRSLKVRCLLSGQGKICQKCVRSGTECVFEDQKPRRKREKPDSRARVAALERKLEEVIAQVSQNKSTSGPASIGKNDSTNIKASENGSQRGTGGCSPSLTASEITDTVNHLPTPESQIRDGDTGHAFSLPSSHEGGRSTLLPTFSQYPSDSVTPEALIAQGYLTIEGVEAYLDKFRQMCTYFPFVMIPSHATVDTMLGERPLLLHSALAVATSSEVHLQKALEKSFKEIMLRRLILEAEKSIDLLQSILICIAWCQFFHVPKRDQSYQLLQMANGLCIDLGLNLTPSSAMHKIGRHLDHYHPSGNAERDLFWSKEARRAYLGCYHVSTLSNWIWAKPNTLEYSEYILQCAKSISEAPEYPTDELVLPLIQLHRTGDEYHKVLRAGRNEIYSQGLLDRIGTHTRSFHKRIRDLRDSFTPAVASSTAVQLAIHFAAVYTNEQDLLSPFTSLSRMVATGAPMDAMSNHIDCPSRVDILLDCLQAAVNYLDFFLNIPIDFYELLAWSQWAGLVYSIVIMYRLSIGTPRVPLWDIQVARDTVKLERYLQIVCDRIQQATNERGRAVVETSKRDLYSVMGLVLQNVRNTYERLRRLPQNKSSIDEAPVHVTSFSEQLADEEALPQPRPGPIFQQEMAPRSGYQNRCPALQFWTTPQSSEACADSNIGPMIDDPFLGGNMLDDDGFWSQAFADMAGAEQVNWNTTANIAGA